MLIFFIICIILLYITLMTITIIAGGIVAVIIAIIALCIQISKNKELTHVALTSENAKRLNKFIPTKKVYKYLYIDEINKLWCVPKLDFKGNIKKKNTIIYRYSDIIDFKIQVYSQTIRSSNGVHRAIVGGAIFGKTGAIAGSNTATRIVDKSYSVVITVNDMRRPNIDIKVGSLADANKINSILQLIQYENATNNISVTDEIRKTTELLDTSTITEQEFEFKKKEFINGEKKVYEEEKEIEGIVQYEYKKIDSNTNSSVSNVKADDLRNALDNVKKILIKVLKTTWNGFRYFISIFCILGGIIQDPIFIPFGIAFCPLTYKILLKHNKKMSEKTIKNISIFLSIITVILIGIFGKVNYFKETDLSLTVGQNYEIDFLVEPENYKMVCSNEDVVILKDNEIIAKEVGTARIELYINEEIKDTIEIFVKDIE